MVTLRSRSPALGTIRRWPKRFFGRWWRKQSASRQDRYATLGPLVAVMMFLVAIVLAFWYLRTEEYDREQESVRRNTEIVQQGLRLRLIETQEDFALMARDMVTRQAQEDDFAYMAQEFTRGRPEITRVIWVAPDRRVIATHYTSAYMARRGNEWLTTGDDKLPDDALTTFDQAITGISPIYSATFTDTRLSPLMMLHAPFYERGVLKGVMILEYALDVLLRFGMPPDTNKQHAFSLVDEKGKVITTTAPSRNKILSRNTPLVYDVPVLPGNDSLRLRGVGARTSIGLIGSTLFWMVTALSFLTVWMLLGTWRHMRRRMQMQSALVSEANFRRAMENSMLTGMRAMDMNGRITYVNPAFCEMTGYSEEELLGQDPPYPHWPNDRIEENRRMLAQELQGRSPAGGIEVRAMRKDGTEFDARMYVSPLIDPRGVQTGWMTSMTNITDAKRVRDQLTAAHERFTTVLEGLDAAVSVLDLNHNEHLFSNRSYRLWFGADPKAHHQLAHADTLIKNSTDGDEPQTDEQTPAQRLAVLKRGLAQVDNIDHFGGLPSEWLTESSAESREEYLESVGRWFDVRTRYLQWTDGRLAQMLIATDITERHQAQAQAAAQAEKAQVNSRLITMGEMASSVAHELNQPLTAISNYCNGMISRVKSDAIAKEDLIAALEKTAKQAQRAGQTIHRIRNFVKRSEPQRQVCAAEAIVEDALDLAGIELRRRRVALHSYLAQRLPTLVADPILIEQVLLNLIKNAAEAIDNAAMPTGRRQIELRVVPRRTEDEGSVLEFSVTDTGPGIKSEMINRLYEAFFTTKADGLGIGLSLCRSIVESHRGRMKAENLYNGSMITGCRFSFTLPVEDLPLEAQNESAPESTNPEPGAFLPNFPETSQPPL